MNLGSSLFIENEFFYFRLNLGLQDRGLLLLIIHGTAHRKNSQTLYVDAALGYT